MERVVYLLGAGFSKPFGLPVMTDFLEKSKDMFSLHSEKYKHFDKVFNEIDKMSKSTLYYLTDVFNIEEVLSILEMHCRLGEPNLRECFTRYVKDVIEYYTPDFSQDGIKHDSQSWYYGIFGSKWSSELRRNFGYFVSSLYHLNFQRELVDLGNRETDYRVQFRKIPDPQISYSIITLNYDLLLENVCDFINGNFDNIEKSLPFSVKQEVQVQLDKKIIPDGLRQEFANNNTKLSQNVSIEKIGNTWHIKDEQQVYIIIWEEDKLNIYKKSNDNIAFVTDKSKYDKDNSNPVLAKLHGSIDTDIIPPTWNKSEISNKKILDAWELAHKVLIEANYIRIIGYSLPSTDTYIKYLLRSAAIRLST